MRTAYVEGLRYTVLRVARAGRGDPWVVLRRFGRTVAAPLDVVEEA